MVDLSGVDRRTVLGLLAGSGVGMGGYEALAAPQNGGAFASVGPAGSIGNCDHLSDPRKPVWVTRNSTFLEPTASGSPPGGHFRIAYQQHVWYHGSNWDETDGMWEHEFSVTSMGLGTEWRQDSFGTEGLCPPPGVDPENADCIPERSRPPEDNEDVAYLGAWPSPRFSNLQRLEIALDEESGNFGTLRMDYQSNNLIFWDHVPFLQDGVDPEWHDPPFTGTPLEDRYAHPEIITNQWADGWNQPVGTSAAKSLVEKRDRLIHELENFEDPPIDADDILVNGPAVALGIAGATTSLPATGVVGAIVSLAPILYDVFNDSSRARSRVLPSQAFREEVELSFPVPIVGHHARFHVLSPPATANTTMRITSRVGVDSFVSDQLGSAMEHTTNVNLTTSPEPGPAERLDWVFDDNMFRTNKAGVDQAGGQVIEPRGLGARISAPTGPIEAGDRIVFQANSISVGDAELDAFAWLWAMEQPGETPQVGRVCSTGASTIDDLVIPANDFAKPGQLTVWCLVRDTTGLWSRSKASVEVVEGASTPTPTPTPDPCPDGPQVTETFESGGFTGTFVDVSESNGTLAVTDQHARNGTYGLLLDSPAGGSTRSEAKTSESWSGENAFTTHVKPVTVDGSQGGFGVRLYDRGSDRIFSAISSGYFGGIQVKPYDANGNPVNSRRATFGDLLPEGTWSQFTLGVTSSGIEITAGAHSHVFATDVDWTQLDLGFGLYSNGWGSGDRHAAAYDDVRIECLDGGLSSE